MTELCVLWFLFPIVFSYKINKHQDHIQITDREWCLLAVREVENEIKIKNSQLRIVRMPLQSLSNKTNNTLSGDNSHSHHFIKRYLFIYVLSSNLMVEATIKKYLT